MKKALDMSLEFETDEERDTILKAVENGLGKQGNTRAIVSTHDCYHDEGKPCKNKVVIRDDLSDTSHN
jgi:hypothetical protein